MLNRLLGNVVELRIVAECLRRLLPPDPRVAGKDRQRDQPVVDDDRCVAEANTPDQVQPLAKDLKVGAD